MILHNEILQIINNDDDVLEPETLRQLYPDMSEREFNHTMALKTLRSTRAFWENFYVFEDIVLALNGLVPNFTIMEGCLPEQIWYALDIAHRMFPEREYATEILKYVQYFLNESGVFIYPPYLPIPNPYYSAAVHRSEVGPFPLTDNSVEEIQAAKYLNIQEYIKTYETKK